MDRWQQWLYRSHSEAELSEWARRLRYFRFCRAAGGHANDGDELLLFLRHRGGRNLEKLWGELQLPVLSAGVQVLGTSPVYVSIQPKHVSLQLSGADGDFYEVTQRDVERAELVESMIQVPPERWIDPPRDSEYCICPQYYPQFWQG